MSGELHFYIAMGTRCFESTVKVSSRLSSRIFQVGWIYEIARVLCRKDDTSRLTSCTRVFQDIAAVLNDLRTVQFFVCDCCVPDWEIKGTLALYIYGFFEITAKYQRFKLLCSVKYCNFMNDSWIDLFMYLCRRRIENSSVLSLFWKKYNIVVPFCSILFYFVLLSIK